MPPSDLLRVAVLVDLPRSASSGGHVKCWERLAKAAAHSPLPLDLTVYFSGLAADESLGPQARLRHLAPVFSTARLKFLPYMPDNTDLAPWHAGLARELSQYDVIHTTDGFFAFAQTAAKVGRRQGIPLVTSFHTDMPAYTRIFTRQTIEKLTDNWPIIQRKLIQDWKWPERQGQGMERKLERHIRACRYAFVSRPEDRMVAEKIVGAERVKPLRLGIDKDMFGPHRADRSGVRREFGIAEDRIVVLFVGRVDIGKNISTLLDGMAVQIAAGVPLHLIVAGVGPAEDEARKKLGQNVTLAGYVKPPDLARLYASVDLLALPSEVEIRNMAVGEALASGCPVMVSTKSGIAPLFNGTPAMQAVDGEAPAWGRALKDFCADTGRRQLMRMAAINYGANFLPGWRDVLAEDLFPVWRRAADDEANSAPVAEEYAEHHFEGKKRAVYARISGYFKLEGR